MARTDFHVIRSGEPSRAPNVAASLRTRLAEMARPLRDAALVGSGLGVAETEQLAQAMVELAKASRDDARETRLSTVPGATARAFKDLDLAEKAIQEARHALAAGIDGDMIDPDGTVVRGITQGVSLCMRAQATIGAVRLAQS